MPIRRTSQPGSPATMGSMSASQSHAYLPSAGGSASSRMRQPGELTREYGSISDFGTISGRAGESSGEHRVVQALVGRLVNKLPANSGMRLATVEQDHTVQATVEALLKLANVRLPLVVQGLAAALETLSKYSATTHIQDTPLDALQSQVFLLHVLHLCLTASWRQHAYRSAARPPSNLPRIWPDPPALDETTARFLLSTLLAYTRVVSSDQSGRAGTSSPAPSRDRNRESAMAAQGRRAGLGHAAGNSGGYALGTKFLQARSFASAHSPTRATPPSLLGGNRFIAAKCLTPSGTITQMTRLVARTVFYLSASNWSLIMARIKAKISFLTTTIEESPDITDLRLLDWVNVDRLRLGQLIQEVSSTLLHVKRPGQVAVAIGLRRAIWNFLDAYPNEYEALVESNRKIEGNVDMLFDVLASAADTTSSSSLRRTRAFYPLMAMLLVLCPDTLKRAVMGDTGTTSRSILGVGGGSLSGASGVAKKVQFLENLRKGIVSAKGYEACILCYVDLARASLRLSPRLESAGIKSLVLDIQNELKNAVLSPMASDLSDQQTIVDGLVSVYRLNAASQTSSNVLARLLVDASDAKKLLAVKGCIVIIAEGNSLPWLPPVSGLWRATSAQIRALLRSCASGIHGDISVARRPVPPADIPEGLSDLTKHVLALVALDPAFAFAGSSADQSPSDGLTQSLLCLSALTVGPTPEDIRLQASMTVVSVLEHVALSVKGNESMAGALSSASTVFWSLLIDVSRQQMHDFHLFDFEGIGISAEALRMTVQAMLRIIEDAPETVVFAPNASSAILVGMVAGLMSVIALNLCSTSTCQPMFSGLSTIQKIVSDAQANRISPELRNTRELESKRRIATCQQLAALKPALGRQHFQRQLRSIVRDSAHPQPDVVALLISMVSAVKAMSGRIIAAESRSMGNRDPRRRGLAGDIEGLDEDLARFWQDLVALVCPLSAVSAVDLSAVPHITSSVGRGILPKQLDETTEPAQAVESFLRDCVDLLVSNSVTVRETVKEALGNELPRSLCPVLVVQMTKMLNHASGPAGMIPSDPFTTFIEQAIAVLRSNVDRIQTGADGASVQLDLGDLLLSIGQYVQRLGRDDTSLRLKSRYCLLAEAVLSRPEDATISNEVKFRHLLLEWIAEWSIDVSRDTEAYQVMLEANGKAQRALDTACLRVMVPLTEDLVLKSPGHDAATQTAMKSRLFHRHFAHLVKVLERNTASEDDSFHRSRSMTNVSSHQDKSAHDDAAPSLAIAALSNLLAANIDVGLKHCLTLGYYDDPALRGAFMQLVSRVLQRGTKFGGTAGGLGGPSAKRLSNAPKPYLDQLKDGNLALAVAIIEACPPSEVDEISVLLFRVFEAKGTLLALLKVLVDREVTLTNHESELFRANSITTRMLTIYAKTYGYNYVRATLQPLVNSLCEKPEQCSFELDPSKAAPGEDIERNADHLRLMCQALLDLICSSIPRVPVMFRALCHHIWEVVEDRFPDSRHSAVGSFIFLRFFCPAIIAPESIDLDVRPDSPQIRRGMLLITKVIQNLANNVVFGTTKEPHMRILNQFLSENIRQVTKFLSDVAVRPRSMEVAQAIKTYQNEAERSADPDGDNAIIHTFVCKHQSKLAELLEGMPVSYRHASSTRSNKHELQGRAAWQKLRETMELTGAAADHSKLSPATRNKIYEEFMRQNQGRSTEAAASAFYEGPTSQNGKRMFYFIVARAAMMDYDLLAYRVFSVLESVNDVFDIIIDLSDFSSATELPMPWLKRCVQMCPPSILSSVGTIILYNPNSHAKKRVRRIMAELSLISGPVGKNVIAASSPAELAETISFTSLALPDHTLELAYEADNVFTGLHVLAQHEQQVPVVVKLGHDCLQIASWKKQDIASGMKAYIIDVVRLKDVEDVVLGAGLASDQLTVKHSQTESVTFISRKRNEMSQIIRAARAKLRDSPAAERALRPGDVPGALLNVALLNLSSEDEALRLGAYNLVNELCHCFKYDLGSARGAVSAGFAIPRNAVPFAMAISRQLATSAPQLTLELLKEWIIGFSKADVIQKTACLQYIRPWLVNLEVFAQPSRDDAAESVKQVNDIIKGLIAITVAERQRLQLLIHANVWSVFVGAPEHLADMLFGALLHTAIDSGLESDKSETAAEILVTIASLSLRGKLVARLRKTIAQTYLAPSNSLEDNAAWSEICVLTRLNVLLSFHPGLAIDTQLYLPELAHCITILLGSSPLIMRQMIYALLVNVLQSLSSSTPTGEMDQTTLQALLAKLQTTEALGWFGLHRMAGTVELGGGARDESGEAVLAHVEAVAHFLGQVLGAAAVSIDCCNSWRARWMSLVAATCFQHNPATQPQAFTVLGYLASDEVDDDLVYQIVVAMSTTLSQFAETDTGLVISMLRCLTRVVAGLVPDSRYATSLFWLAVGVLQLSWVPLFPAALDLLVTSLRYMVKAGLVPLDQALSDSLLETRRLAAGDTPSRLDTAAGINFDADPNFSLAAVLFKGVRIQASRALTIEALMDLLKLSVQTARTQASQQGKASEGNQVAPASLAYFIALLPAMAGSSADLKGLFEAAGVAINEQQAGDVSSIGIFDMLNIPDNSTALMLITFVVAMLSSASSETERIVLYSLLADASHEIPDVLSMVYDSLVPRLTAVLGTTSNTTILNSVSTILERAMLDPVYTFGSSGFATPGGGGSIGSSGMQHSDSLNSLHAKSAYASAGGGGITASPSMAFSASMSAAGTGSPALGGPGRTGGRGEAVLDELGMRGLADVGFPAGKMERVAPAARYVSALIESFTI